jgi:hypothetical protein
MSDVRLVGIVDEEGFVVADPCVIEALLRSVVWGVAQKDEGVIEERAPDGVAVLDGVVGAE